MPWGPSTWHPGHVPASCLPTTLFAYPFDAEKMVSDFSVVLIRKNAFKNNDSFNFKMLLINIQAQKRAQLLSVRLRGWSPFAHTRVISTWGRHRQQQDPRSSPVPSPPHPASPSPRQTRRLTPGLFSLTKEDLCKLLVKCPQCVLRVQVVASLWV